MALVHPEARQAVLSALPPAYYEKSFDSVGSASNVSVAAEIVVACVIVTGATCAVH